MKTILHSKRANIFYLDQCRVMVKDGIVVYLTENQAEKQYWNIPIANTTMLLFVNCIILTHGVFPYIRLVDTT
jgi:CRISPR-associated protein Cas1